MGSGLHGCSGFRAKREIFVHRSLPQDMNTFSSLTHAEGVDRTGAFAKSIATQGILM